MCLWEIWISLEKFLFRCLVIFKWSCLFVVVLLLNSNRSLKNFLELYSRPFPDKWLQIFSTILWMAFSFSWECLFMHKSFQLWWSQMYVFFSFDCCALSVISKKSLPYPRSQRFMPMFSLKSFIVLALWILMAKLYHIWVLCFNPLTMKKPVLSGLPD